MRFAVLLGLSVDALRLRNYSVFFFPPLPPLHTSHTVARIAIFDLSLSSSLIKATSIPFFLLHIALELIVISIVEKSKIHIRRLARLGTRRRHAVHATVNPVIFT